MKLTDALYAASPDWVQDLLITAYGWQLRRARYGGIHAQTLRDLRQTQTLDRATLVRLQLERLRATLADAARTVPYYRDRGPLPAGIEALDDLLEVPLLTKAQVQAAGPALISATRADRTLHTVHTGGTTGTPLHVRCDAATLQRNYAFFSRFKEWAGVPAGARTATFAGRNLVTHPDPARFWRRNRAANTWLFSSYHIAPDTVTSYVQELIRMGPELIDAYPSSLEPIARHIIASGITSVRPKAVITSSETLGAEARKLMEEAFGCRVFDHYGGGEMVAFIAQCDHGSWHVNPEFGVVEVLQDGKPVSPGETGEIVATGFINPVMPLIRYATGDLAVQGSMDPCGCGRAFHKLERIEGRMDDVIVTPEGRRVGRLDPVFKVLTTPFETRIIHDLPDHVLVEYVAARELPSDEEAALRSELTRRLGPSMRISVRQVPRIERTGRGKLRTVVSLLNEDGAGTNAQPGGRP